MVHNHLKIKIDIKSKCNCKTSLNLMKDKDLVYKVLDQKHSVNGFHTLVDQCKYCKLL